VLGATPLVDVAAARVTLRLFQPSGGETSRLVGAFEGTGGSVEVVDEGDGDHVTLAVRVPRGTVEVGVRGWLVRRRHGGPS
jgi:hypothetical protein